MTAATQSRICYEKNYRGGVGRSPDDGGNKYLIELERHDRIRL